MSGNRAYYISRPAVFQHKVYITPTNQPPKQPTERENFRLFIYSFINSVVKRLQQRFISLALYKHAWESSDHKMKSNKQITKYTVHRRSLQSVKISYRLLILHLIQCIITIENLNFKKHLSEQFSLKLCLHQRTFSPLTRFKIHYPLIEEFGHGKKYRFTSLWRDPRWGSQNTNDEFMLSYTAH